MNLDLRFYWSLLKRRLPVMLVFVVICSAIGVLTAIRLPETWSSSARLLVEAPQIPDTMVRSTVQTDVVEQLDIIEQRLMTRANLIDIANRHQVFENMSEMDPNDVVGVMAASTRIQRRSGTNMATLMTISFEARSGQIAADVVNEYVTLVLEANVENRIGRAEETLSFFEQEVADLSADLDEVSTRIASFRAENAGALPEDRSLRVGRQDLLTERLAGLERELRSGEAQRADITRIFESTGQVGPRSASAAQTVEERQLDEARAELELLLSRYSETNFRVVEQRNLVERLEDVVATQATAAFPETEDGPATPEQALFQVTLAELDNRLASVRAEIDRTNAELDEIQSAIERSALNQIELQEMEREYEILQSRYDSAVANLNQAQMSERIETTARGQRITVIENAVVPRFRSGPDRKMVAAAGGALGLGLAGAYFVLLELLNRRIRRPAELQSRFGITPIMTIPYMESTMQKVMRRAGLVGATMAVLFGVPALLWYIDQNVMPIQAILEVGLARLGIG